MKPKPGSLCCLLLAQVLALVSPKASAHRLDEYLQALRISVATNRVELSIDLTPGVAIADELLALIDPDRDGQVSDQESAAYTQRILKDLKIAVDENTVALRLVTNSFPSVREIRGGVGVIRMKATASVGPLAVGRHSLTLTNAHLPNLSVYLVNALQSKEPAVEIGRQTRDELQRGYRLEFRVREVRGGPTSND